MSAHSVANSDGTTTRIFDDSDGSVVVANRQDVAPILARNAELRAAGANSGANGRLAASIPVVIYQQWDKEFKAKHGVGLMAAPKDLKQGFLYRKLNDAAHKKLRTWEGRL